MRPCSDNREFRLKCPQNQQRPSPRKSFNIVIPVWSARQKQRRIFPKECGQCFSYDIGKFVFGDLVPYVEEKMAIRPQDPTGLPIGFDLLGKKHDAELADDDIKFVIPKRQRRASACRHVTRS